MTRARYGQVTTLGDNRYLQCLRTLTPYSNHGRNSKTTQGSSATTGWYDRPSSFAPRPHLTNLFRTVSPLARPPVHLPRSGRLCQQVWSRDHLPFPRTQWIHRRRRQGPVQRPTHVRDPARSRVLACGYRETSSTVGFDHHPKVGRGCRDRYAGCRRGGLYQR